MDVNLNVSGKLTALQVMQDAPVIPVIVLSDVKQAVLLARALVAGGIRMLEVTLRTPVALACIEAIAKEVPEAVVGAGTVRSASDAQEWSRREPAKIEAAQVDGNGHGVGRELFAGMRRNALAAEEGACTWL